MSVWHYKGQIHCFLKKVVYNVLNAKRQKDTEHFTQNSIFFLIFSSEMSHTLFCFVFLNLCLGVWVVPGYHSPALLPTPGSPSGPLGQRGSYINLLKWEAFSWNQTQAHTDTEPTYGHTLTVTNIHTHTQRKLHLEGHFQVFLPSILLFLWIKIRFILCCLP